MARLFLGYGSYMMIICQRFLLPDSDESNQSHAREVNLLVSDKLPPIIYIAIVAMPRYILETISANFRLSHPADTSSTLTD